MSRCMHLRNDVVRGILPKTGVLSSPHIARPPLPTMPISRAPQTNAEEGLREQATARATWALDELAASATPAVREEMLHAFRMSARFEWLFWDSAYRREQWPIALP